MARDYTYQRYFYSMNNNYANFNNKMQIVKEGNNGTTQ